MFYDILRFRKPDKRSDGDRRFYSNGAYMPKPVRFIVKADKLYNRTEKYRAVVAMSEKALYADIVLRKGIVR